MVHPEEVDVIVVGYVGSHVVHFNVLADNIVCCVVAVPQDVSLPDVSRMRTPT